ncbi:MAG: GAF domain-containing protein [Chloroflexota bacterium]|nr:GAF domain-containing protein [Chloroflexota bacterium]
MSERLAHWLETHEPILVPRWARRIRERGVSDEKIGTGELRSRFFVHAYAGLVAAARGDYGLLSAALEGAPQLCGRTDQTLPQLLEVPFQLRRLVWDLALQDDDAPMMMQVLAELEPLTEWMVGVLSRQFGQGIERALRQQIDEAEFMATQLAVATEEADLVALRNNRLYTFSQALGGSLKLQDLVNTIGHELQQALGTERCAIWLCADHQLFNAQAWGYPQPLHTVRYAVDEPCLVPEALRRAEPWLLPDPSATLDGGWVDPQAALLALPLIAGDARLGVIVVQGAQERLTADQVALAQALASQAALALENARLYEQIVRLNTELEQRIQARTQELSTERDRLDLLFSISSTVSSTLDVDTLLTDLLQVLAQRMAVTHGSVMLLDAETSQLVRRATLGPTTTEISHFPIGHGVAGWVAQQREAVLIDDVTVDPRWVELGPPDNDGKHGGSLLAVPLITSDELLGVLILSHPDIGYFRIEHHRLLTVVANEVAVALRNADLYHYISEQAGTLANMVQAERAASSQSQAILQSIADGVVVCDCNGQVMLANPMSAQILEQPIEELFMVNIHDVLRTLKVMGPEREPLQEVLDAPLDEHGQPRQFRATFRSGPRSVDMALGPVLAESGELLGGVAILRDITKEIESDRLKTEFIGTVSHELRTPMTVIKGYVQLLGMGSMGDLSPMQRQLLDTIKSNAERMTAIINDLLDITKIESGSVELNFRPINILDAIHKAVSGQQTLLESRKHQLRIDVAPDMAPGLADAARLQQVLDNILSNAIKFTPKNGKIRVEARMVTGANVPEERRAGLSLRRNYVQIAVRDNGIGMAPEELGQIFERFYRAESELKVEAGGTGLGLAIVRPLVQLMGGRLGVDSERGEGSTFTLLLPAA